LAVIGSALLQVSVDRTEPERQQRCDRCGSTEAELPRPHAGLVVVVLMPQIEVVLAT
jgi:hypothetical protein